MNHLQTIYLYELLELNFFLGIITFCTGSILFSFLLIKIRMARKQYWIYIFIQFVLSYLLSLLIWFLWRSDTDIMIACFSIPAWMAEILASVIVMTWHITFEKKLNKSKKT